MRINRDGCGSLLALEISKNDNECVCVCARVRACTCSLNAGEISTC